MFRVRVFRVRMSGSGSGPGSGSVGIGWTQQREQHRQRFGFLKWVQDVSTPGSKSPRVRPETSQPQVTLGVVPSLF